MIDDSRIPQMRVPNEIDLIDKGVLSSFFNSSGYVLDFSTDKFNQFTSHSVGVALCSHYGLSKGKSLEAFTTYGAVDKVVRLYDDLIRYYEFNYALQLKENPAQRQQLQQLKTILNKYRSNGISLSSVPAIRKVDDAYIREISDRAQKDIENADYKELQKVKAALYRKGFSMDIINKTLDSKGLFLDIIDN